MVSWFRLGNETKNISRSGPPLLEPNDMDALVRERLLEVHDAFSSLIRTIMKNLGVFLIICYTGWATNAQIGTSNCFREVLHLRYFQPTQCQLSKSWTSFDSHLRSSKSPSPEKKEVWCWAQNWFQIYPICITVGRCCFLHPNEVVKTYLETLCLRYQWFSICTKDG